MPRQGDSRFRLAASGVALGVVLALASPAASQTAGGETPSTKEAKRPRASAEDICKALAQAAADNELPLEFFTRLIWQESRFDPHAVSSKGAMGIAQFMPGTASSRGLADPFEPLAALAESASYLRELRTTFGGNLGLAAAAYNAGPGRVEAWLSGRSRALPGETRAYVEIITGHSADAWASKPPPQWKAADLPKGAPCTELAKLIVTPRPRPAAPAPNPAWGPWGVQLAGHWSEGRVLATYERLRRRFAVLADREPLVLRARLPGRRGAAKFIVRVSEGTRQGAEALCGRLRAAGAACIVLRNPRR